MALEDARRMKQSVRPFVRFAVMMKALMHLSGLCSSKQTSYALYLRLLLCLTFHVHMSTASVMASNLQATLTSDTKASHDNDNNSIDPPKTITADGADPNNVPELCDEEIRRPPRGFAEFHHSRLSSDMSLTCDNTIFHVHRIVVFEQSAKLKALICGQLGSDSNEFVDIGDHDRDTIARMVSYMYTGVYQKDTNLSTDRSLEKINWSTTAELLMHVKVHAAAEFYEAPHLKALAARKFIDELNTTHEGEDRIEFEDLVPEVYRLPVAKDTGLRQAIAAAAGRHMRAKATKSAGAFESLMVEGGQLSEFGRDVTEWLAAEAGKAEDLRMENRSLHASLRVAVAHHEQTEAGLVEKQIVGPQRLLSQGRYRKTLPWTGGVGNGGPVYRIAKVFHCEFL